MFAFKYMLIPIKFFFCVFKTHIADLIQLVIIKGIFNCCICFILSAYFLVFLQYYFINCTINDRIIILLPGKYISFCSIVPTFLSRNTFKILRTKVSLDLAFI